MDYFECIGFGAAVVDARTRAILQCNRAFLALTHATAAADGLRWSGATPADRLPATTEQSWPRADGRKSWTRARVSDLPTNDGPRWLVVLEDITPAHEAREELAREHERLVESERRLATLLANLPGMAYRCRNEPDWPIDFASGGMLPLCGVHPEELKNAPLAFNELIHPADQARVWSDVQAAVARKECYQFEYRIRSRSGEEKWVWEQGCGIFGARGELVALEGLIMDVTERKRAGALALEWKSRYETAAVVSGQLLYDWNPGEDFIEFGGAAKETLGYDVSELNGSLSHWSDFVHPEDRAPFEQACARVQSTGEYFRLSYRVRHKQGHYVLLEDSGCFVRTDHGARMIGFARDVSERQRAEETRQRLEDELRQAQKLEAIGQLSGGIAHDFNNILTVIQGHVGFLEQERSLSEQGGRSLQEIDRSAKRAANLTHQLLAFGRRQNIRLSRIDLNRVVANLTAMLQRLISEPTQLEVRCSEGSLWVEADAVMLEQVLLNLAGNARDAMAEGGALLVETFVREVQAADLAQMPQGRPGLAVVLRVTDSGHGIKPEDLPRIFEPFFTTKDVGQGTGLGLATVYGIVQQHHGWMTVQSELGRGSSFSVFLPRATAPESVTDQPAAPATAGRGHGILLVEDEEPVRVLLAALLRKNGYNVFEARSGPEALNVWDEHARKIKVLVTDLVMPDGMSGRALAERLLAIKPALGVIYMSGYSPEFAAKNLDLQPGLNFIAKPSDLPKLLPAIQNILSRPMV